MSTLSVGTIQSNSSAPPTIKNSSGTEIGTLCRAWVNFAGATGTVAASFNVSSVTRTGTGQYTINFTNAMPDANYSQIGFGRSGSNSNGQQTWAYSFTAATSSAFYLVFQSMGAAGATYTNIDPTTVSAAIFR